MRDGVGGYVIESKITRSDLTQIRDLIDAGVRLNASDYGFPDLRCQSAPKGWDRKKASDKADVPFLKNHQSYALPGQDSSFHPTLTAIILLIAAISAVDVPSQSAGGVSEIICIND